jgi:hypothetical protein
MAIIETIREFDYTNVWLIILGVIPYADHETVGLIPFVRDVVPTVEPIHFWSLSWTERGRLAAFIVVPVVDGEWLNLLFGVDVNDLIADKEV